MSDCTDTSPPLADLYGLARLVEQDGITSDILPAYLQALQSVRLIEPDYLCRKAAVRLAGHVPPLSAGELADALCVLGRHTCSKQPATVFSERKSERSPRSFSLSLKKLLNGIRRIWATKSQ